MHRAFGLTGGIACGKSTVARFFESLGAKIIDADRVGHELLEAPGPVQQRIAAQFGREILGPGGEVDRGRLGAMVFADPEKLKALNSIVHPAIIARIDDLTERLHASDAHAVIIVDAALIFEAGLAGRFSKIVVAWCEPEQQVERLISKAGISRQDALRRIASQMPAEEKRGRADYVIECSGSLEESRAQVEALYPVLKRLTEQGG